GDYDVDGICSTTVMLEGLAELGARVIYHVPDRFSEGYGVSRAAVERAARLEAGLFLTVDCGSSNRAEVELARQLGMKVVVTDHHHVPAQPPRADAFLNPHRDDCSYPYPGLCGTGIAFKLIQALRQRRGLSFPTHLMDLVGLATVADVVPLTGENRALVRTGLELLGRLERPGLRALAELSGIPKGPVGAWSVAFGLGPRLNAAGRLEHAGLGVELLQCTDPEECRRRAEHLDRLNQKRRDIEKEMRLEIEARLEEEPEKLELGVLVEAGDDWHEGVIGITASRFADRYAIPAVVLSTRGELSKGSGRSPENVNLYRAMLGCQDLFVKFGGHERAGGFTIETRRIPELRVRLAEEARKLRTGPAPIRVDRSLSLGEATLELARELQCLEPVGEGNPKPLFLARRVRLERVRTIGQDSDHLSFLAWQGRVRRKAVAFRQGADLDALAADRYLYDLLFHLQEETWEGQTYASLVVEGIVAPEPALVQLMEGAPEAPTLSPYASDRRPLFFDLRNVLDRRRCLKRLLDHSSDRMLVVGSESQAARTRQHVQEALGEPVPVVSLELAHPQPPAEDLILLTPPASLDSLRHPLLWNACRVYLLFEDGEPAKEQTIWLDRPRMEVIWKGLVRCAQEGVLEEEEFPRLARQLSLPSTSPDTIRAAVGVLEELGVASWEKSLRGRRLRLGRGRGRSLEESDRFRELARQRLELQQVRRVLQEPGLSWLEALRGA
ncbi:MAG: single-stranded-DNA-specific exonuclease RecJ, partial [Armatimonadetes bacterium]|nr:single-stranded-DNA-specific exonuclease RecJ [Armatimonadota bacterium]